MKATTKVEIITLTVEKTNMGMRCSFRSEKLTFIAPAKRRKFSMAPINTSVKSNSEIRLKKLSVVLGKMLGPASLMRRETKMAISIMPMVEGNFNILRLR